MTSYVGLVLIRLGNFSLQVPRVFVGGECVGGGSETWTLHNQGKLVPKMESAGATFKKKD